MLIVPYLMPPATPLQLRLQVRIARILAEKTRVAGLTTLHQLPFVVLNAIDEFGRNLPAFLTNWFPISLEVMDLEEVKTAISILKKIADE